MKPTTKGMKLGYTEIKIMEFKDWRLLPWYTSTFCENGCCFHRQFTWGFLSVHTLHTRKV